MVPRVHGIKESAYPVFKQTGPNSFLLVESFSTILHLPTNVIDWAPVYEEFIAVFWTTRGYQWTTDFGSVPRIFWVFCSPHEDTEAFFVHDQLYVSRLWYRGIADYDLRQRLIKNKNIPNWKAWVIWFAVRCFGWFYWRSHTRSEVLKARQAMTTGFQPSP